MKKLKLITESNFDILTEEDSNKNLYVTGIFSSANKKNKNGRTYPKHILEREVNKLKDQIKENGPILGELSHPESRCETKYELASHGTEELWWEGDNVYGRAKVLKSLPYGSVLEGLIKEKIKIGISSRALGSLKENNEVSEDLNMICWDATSNPSNYGSWVNGILEGKEFSIPDSHIIEPNEEQIKEAKEEYYKKIWQVIDNIEKNL